MQLNQGQTHFFYTIVAVDGREKERLEALGIYSGNKVRIEVKGPFKGPYICTINDLEIAIDYKLTFDVSVQ